MSKWNLDNVVGNTLIWNSLGWNVEDRRKNKDKDIFISPQATLADDVRLVWRKGYPIIINSKTIILSGSIIYWGTKIGEKCRFGNDVFIRERCKIGNNVTVGTKSIVEWNAEIGDDTLIEGSAFISEATRIGKNCFISPNVVFTSDKMMDGKPYYYDDDGLRNCTGASTVEDNVKIGANTTILPEITIGHDSIISAGCTVVEDVPPNSIMIAKGVKAMPYKPRDYSRELAK